MCQLYVRCVFVEYGSVIKNIDNFIFDDPFEISKIDDHSIFHMVFVGNWDATSYGRELWRTYVDCDNLTLLKPIYDEDRLYTLRRGAEVYVHGHSAGGTNPSLVEMMHFGIPVIAFDCVFNRYSTDDEAIYFFTAEDLADAVNAICDKIDKAGSETVDQLGQKMANIAKKRYVWSVVGELYLNILGIRPVD